VTDAVSQIEHAEVATLIPFAEQFATSAIQAVASNPTDLHAAAQAIGDAASSTAKAAVAAGVKAGAASLAVALSTAIAQAHGAQQTAGQ